MSATAKMLAVLCADITGGAQLQAALPASEAEHALRRCEKRITQTVEGFKGRLVKSGTCRVLAYFSETADALQSAVDMQKRVAALPPLSGISLGVRVGVCVGHSSNESRFFEDDADNPAASLSRIAQPGQLLLSIPERASSLRWPERVAQKLPSVSLRCGKRQLGVFEVDWRNCEAANLRLEETAQRQLAVHLDQTRVLINSQHPVAILGRLGKCDIRLLDERASRIHARIERRQEQFVLIDQSTNGTFVTLDGGAEQHIRHAELILSRSGILNCYGPAATTTEGTVRFHLEAMPGI